MRGIVEEIEGTERQSLTTQATTTYAFAQRMHRMAIEGTVLLPLCLVGAVLACRRWLFTQSDTEGSLHFGM